MSEERDPMCMCGLEPYCPKHGEEPLCTCGWKVRAEGHKGDCPMMVMRRSVPPSAVATAKEAEPRFFAGQKIRILTPLFGWERGLYIEPCAGRHRVLRMEAANCDFVPADRIQASEWVEQRLAEPVRSAATKEAEIEEAICDAVLAEMRRWRGTEDHSEIADRITAAIVDLLAEPASAAPKEPESESNNG